ncbi:MULTISPECIES: holo-ACP synthase [Aneurinibacillus]|uniref:Holo-[acyl-carrier-protein] synthase n=1 Tax=Aneurinibacillus thermoaerophilus TaxID=143495 RepID=A0A1G8D2X6_ANETH|nr:MULTISPECIES: holo-ACP synthase [Aneurinibacillus]AMA74258.1 hypothetical protein ACH33_16555 [Aneurinibacillus sp. XH2]MED0675737.1 holo-ACP synthase [Aneurinibacillus thermoaerophilus]MED0680721.1 holo-ACP synthase [Aneurinibacillus thermoaerophilus]MED0736779.1 holo-ACP synthase [Aneurinibacillus thermoaerophilus]MED0758873.1 holo-ACP synthase [Aneurinibacillus thermoaerophilus]
MIIGMGIDIVELDRIRKILARQEKSFLNRIFTEREIGYIPEAKARRAEFVAGRYAAKEAIAKALGTGIGKRFSFRDAEIIPENGGRPIVVIRSSFLHDITGYSECCCHLSISHSEQYAVAQCILEKR